MTTPPLPPEIKSAEDFAKTLPISAHEALKCDYTRPTSDKYKVVAELIHQHDLAIWNAAIEKAAETVKTHTHTKLYITGQMQPIEIRESFQQAILNLKRKE